MQGLCEIDYPNFTLFCLRWGKKLEWQSAGSHSGYVQLYFDVDSQQLALSTDSNVVHSPIYIHYCEKCHEPFTNQKVLTRHKQLIHSLNWQALMGSFTKFSAITDIYNLGLIWHLEYECLLNLLPRLRIIPSLLLEKTDGRPVLFAGRNSQTLIHFGTTNLRTMLTSNQ